MATMTFSCRPDPVSNLHLFSLKYIMKTWKLELGRDETKLSRLQLCSHRRHGQDSRRCEQAIMKPIERGCQFSQSAQKLQMLRTCVEHATILTEH